MILARPSEGLWNFQVLVTEKKESRECRLTFRNTKLTRSLQPASVFERRKPSSFRLTWASGPIACPKGRQASPFWCGNGPAILAVEPMTFGVDVFTAKAGALELGKATIFAGWLVAVGWDFPKIIVVPSWMACNRGDLYLIVDCSIAIFRWWHYDDVFWVPIHFIINIRVNFFHNFH